MWYPYTIFPVFSTVAVGHGAQYYWDNQKVTPYGVYGDRDRNKYLKFVS